MADYAITNVTRRVVYTGSAGVGPYAYSFPVLIATDLAVYKNDAKLTLTTDYTVTINAAGTGSVILVSAATSSDRITIVGARAIQRSTDFVTGGDLFANTLNDELDSQTIFIQQVAETAERALKAPVTDPTSIDMTLPRNTVRAGKLMAFDSLGNPTVGDDVGNWRGNWAAATSYAVRDLVKDASNSNVYRCNTKHTSTGSTPISSNADTAKWDLVVDAAAAGASAAAAASSASASATSATNSSNSAAAAATSATNAATSATTASTQATNAATSATNAANSATSAAASAAAAATALDNFDDRYLGPKASNPTVDNDGDPLLSGALYYRTTTPIGMKVYDGTQWLEASAAQQAALVTYEYVATNGQTTFSGADMTGLTLSYIAGGLIVSLNGVILRPGDDYTATSGTSIVLLSAAAAGDEVNAYAFSSFTVANTYTQAQSDARYAQLAAANTFTAAQRGSVSTLTDAATITPNFALANNFSVTLAGNRTLANPTNLVAGQSGAITITQDATGSRTLAYGSNWKFSSGAAPVLTTTAGAVDVLVYYVESTSRITARLVSDVK